MYVCVVYFYDSYVYNIYIYLFMTVHLLAIRTAEVVPRK